MISVLADHRHCAYVQHTGAPTDQDSSAAVERAQQLSNETEIRCLVLVSFSLQVFLLFSAGFRRQYRLRVLSLLLWLAYLSADHVAVFVLGRLALHPGDQLVLFWAPFLQLHLGGQETITAFSMEDCALWRRHLLNLTTQLALAIYVVGKQWRGNKQLVAPMVLMFISATIKYAERTCALWGASSWAPGSSLEMGTGNSSAHPPDENLALIFSAEESKDNSFERLMEAADEKFQDVMEIFMDVKIKSLSGRLWVTSKKVAIVKWFTSSEDGEWAAAWAARQKVSSSSKFRSAAQRLVRKSAAAQFFQKKSAAQQTLEHSHIKDMDIVPSALVWHLVTEMCLVDDQTPTNRFRTCSQHLSNYIMYLVAQCKLMLDSEGHAAIGEVQYMMARACGTGDSKRRFVRRLRDGDLRTLPLPMQHQDFGRLIADRVTNVSSELLKSEAAGYRWELIAMVWVEMLFYIARNSGSGFHAKQLSAGGEFLTHAKLLVFLLLRVDGDDD